jgi:hypothetical protein
MESRGLWIIALMLAATGAAPAQVAQPSTSPEPAATAEAPGRALPAELSIPFGSVRGDLVISGDILMFIDQAQPGFSFAISRQNLNSVDIQNGMLVVELREPVRNRAGETDHLVFRVLEGQTADPILAWSRAPAGGFPAQPQEQTFSYDAKHDHFIGSDSGRLIIGPERIDYESVTDINQSRQWRYSDIKEIKRDSPYKIEIQPYNGDKYTFSLQGGGMELSTYNLIVQRITGARLRKQR